MPTTKQASRASGFAAAAAISATFKIASGVSIIAQSRTDAERAREETTAKARAEAEKIVESGRQLIEQEKRAAIAEIRQSAVDLALSASSKLLRSQIDDAKSRELVTAYVQELDEQQQS